MVARVFAFLAVAVLGAASIAGCGSSSSSGSNTTTAAAQSATTAASPAASKAAPVTAPSGAEAATVQQAVERCLAAVHAAPNLPASTKTKAEGICNKAGHGDAAGARKAAQEVCVEVVNASPVPASLKEEALSRCKAVQP